MLVFLQVHILAESPVWVTPSSAGYYSSGRALYARPRSDTAHKHTRFSHNLQVFLSRFSSKNQHLYMFFMCTLYTMLEQATQIPHINAHAPTIRPEADCAKGQKKARPPENRQPSV